MMEDKQMEDSNLQLLDLADVWQDLQRAMLKEISSFDVQEAMQYAQSLAHMSSMKKLEERTDKGGAKGDVCIVNFGYNRIHNEANYFMYALVVKVTTNKVLVIPISESREVYQQSFDEVSKKGKIHFMKFSKLMDKVPYPTLVLNDIRFLNSMRIIRIETHISTKDEEFQEIVKRLKKVLF